MSHFIRTDNEIKPPSLLSGQIYQIKAPRPRKISKNFMFERFSTNQTAKTIGRIVQRQSIHGLQLNERKLRESMIILKKRIKLFGTVPQAHIPFQSSQSKPSKSHCKLFFSPTNSVDIKQKYSSELAIKLNAMKETEQIVQYRETMEKWRNSHYNNIKKSPNFCKMNFLIWKVKDCNKEGELFGRTEHLDEGTRREKGISRAMSQKKNPDGIMKVYRTNYKGLLSGASKKKQLTQP